MTDEPVDADTLRRGGLQLAIDGPRATITLDRPEVRGAQTPRTWAALSQIGRSLPEKVRVVVIAGTGRSFSSGLDRRLFTEEGFDGMPGLPSLAAADSEDADARIAEYQTGFSWLADPERLTIAAVHGHAVGAGFQLALACDVRIVADDVQFAMAETQLGLVPDLGGTSWLVRLVGYARAAELCVTGRSVGAEEATRIGLANAAVPAAELAGAVDRFVEAALAAPAAAVTETLRLLSAAADGRPPVEQRAAERAAQLRSLARAVGGASA
ncbi:enoyl-CoA hydratase/isomerase family protein [Actinoalloteichus hymeniacidonis]|uniref:Enoyl-CoA hydratase/carnithine racemase n=1 Tax=Actinoalloteichus hymeniacidonis TaxID=340345 RepID=A0AAC9MY92_9PSEU|nr:enoyl-CoA hydratase/isomerase family protein [Actinoalloteichus hymeniacidonis]AOS63194.1 enoyl-CoA hydratase/carnithine racemase [Actinoalloteichus hymeniacidonis]MBB5908769.1 enoyl-CoA hydratase/carnithine racemase [Actinoalloteichus hymeniacidonis]